MKHSKQISWAPIDPPLERLPPIEVCFEIPKDAAGPDSMQLEMLEQVRAAFPQVWQAVILQ
jgi:hypothetical protein